MKSLFILLGAFFIGFSGCDMSASNTSTENSSNRNRFLEKGNKITTATQKELLKNVSSAMQKGGPVYAIDFCNTRAMELTDSLSKAYNCTIERISFKNRNPDNYPDSETEKEQLTAYNKMHEEGEELMPTVIQVHTKIEYYKPIVVGMETCLKCHGSTESGLTEQTRQQLTSLYPQDKATGYELHDFRGLWKVTFEPE